MNILFVSHEKNINGASLSLIGMIDELKIKNNIYVLTSYKEGLFIEELKKRNIKIIYSRFRWWVSYKPKFRLVWELKRVIILLLCQFNYISAIKIKKIIDKKNIDIIHTNTSVVNIGAIVSKMCKIPHVWHIREFGEEDFNLHFVYGKKYSYKYINENSKKVITVSKAIFSKYIDYIDKRKLINIYNGIDEINLNMKQFDNNSNVNINIIISGAISEAKGQKEAILAIRELLNRGYKNIKLKIAGNGNISELVDLISNLDLTNNIEILGRVNNLFDIRKNIDIELVCSKCEAFGRVTIEAMMGMIVVVGADTGGTKELIKDKYNGLLYRQGDYISLADNIEYLLNNKRELEAIAKNAYFFSKEFTTKRNAQHIDELYKIII